MSIKKTVILTVAFLAVAKVSFAATVAGYTSVGSMGYALNTTTQASSAGETFITPNDGNSYDITSASFYLERVGAACNGSAVARLYSVTGSYGSSDLPSALLATSNSFDISTIATSPTNYTFNFGTTYTMSPNTNYAIVLTVISLSGCDYLYMGRDPNTNGYSGSGVYYDGSWNDASSYDVTFSVLGNVHTSGGGTGSTTPIVGSNTYIFLLTGVGIFLTELSAFLIIMWLIVLAVGWPIKKLMRAILRGIRYS